MINFRSLTRGFIVLVLSNQATAHVGAYGPGMYCRDGPSGTNKNSNDVVNPLFNLTKQDFWFQHDRGCDARPPADGEFLELPAGGTFTVQHANNQAFSDLSYDGKSVSDWPDGGSHPEDWHGPLVGEGCIQDGGYMHTQNESMAQGTAFAIAYQSDLSKIDLDTLVVFSVLKHTPWKNRATYQVPKAMPPCPEGGCSCAYLWVPKGCGQPNMYMQGFKCNVTGGTSNTPLAKAKPAKWCKEDPSLCVKGAKQMIVFNQLEANNVPVPRGETPVYNEACGFQNGAQDDIFEVDKVAISSYSEFTQSPRTSATLSASTTNPSLPSGSPSSTETTSPSSTLAASYQGVTTVLSTSTLPSISTTTFKTSTRNVSSVSTDSSNVLPTNSTVASTRSTRTRKTRPRPSGRPKYVCTEEE